MWGQPAWSSEEERKSDPAVLLVVICCGGEKTGDARQRKAIEGPLPSRETANVMDCMGWDCGGPVTLAGKIILLLVNPVVVVIRCSLSV